MKIQQYPLDKKVYLNMISIIKADLEGSKKIDNMTYYIDKIVDNTKDEVLGYRLSIYHSPEKFTECDWTLRFQLKDYCIQEDKYPNKPLYHLTDDEWLFTMNEIKIVYDLMQYSERAKVTEFVEEWCNSLFGNNTKEPS